MKHKTIKETSKIIGLSEPTLRYYEKEGLILPLRSEGGYRLYSEEDMQVLKYIAVMKYAKFPLQEIKSMIDLLGLEMSEACNEKSKEILNKRIIEVEKTIQTYKSIQMLFENLMNATNGLDCTQPALDVENFINMIYNDIRNDTI